MIFNKSDTLIKMRVFNIVSDVPYSDSFKPEEEWIICSTNADIDKCVIRQCIYINFHESTIMESIIEGKAFTA